MAFTSSSLIGHKCLGFTYPVGDQDPQDHDRVASIPCEKRTSCSLFHTPYAHASTFLFPLALYPLCDYFQEIPSVRDPRPDSYFPPGTDDP